MRRPGSSSMSFPACTISQHYGRELEEVVAQFNWIAEVEETPTSPLEIAIRPQDSETTDRAACRVPWRETENEDDKSELITRSSD